MHLKKLLRFKRFWLCCLAVFILLGLGKSVVTEIEPKGRFSVRKLASEGTAFYEFKNGKVTLVVLPPNDAPAGRIHTKNIGTYTKQNDRWVFVSPDGQLTQLRATLFFVYIGETNGAWPERYPRLFKLPLKRSVSQ